MRRFGGTTRTVWKIATTRRARQRPLYCYSSSSTPRQHEPRLSGKNRRDLFVLATGVFGGTVFVASFRNHDWDDEVRTAKHKLLVASSSFEYSRNNNNNETTTTNRTTTNTIVASSDPNNNDFDDETTSRPPPAIRRYVRAALGSDSATTCKTITTVHQSGEFAASQQWYPFEATLTASSSPGFVWDARTTILGLSNHVLEYYYCHCTGNNDDDYDDDDDNAPPEGKIVTRVWGKYPLIQVEEDDPFVLFWLAMTPLFPGVFLTGRQWKWLDNNNDNDDDDKAFATAQMLCDDGESRKVDFFVRDNGLLERIQVTALRVNNNNNDDDDNDGDRSYCWQANYKDYRERTVTVHCRRNNRKDETERSEITLLVPSSIEIGKGRGDEYRPHIRFRNHRIEYSRVVP
jgi:hypothetical protein